MDLILGPQNLQLGFLVLDRCALQIHLYVYFDCVVMHTSMNPMANLVLKQLVMVHMVSFLFPIAMHYLC